MSLRTGSNSLSLNNPSRARLRQIGQMGRQSQRENRAYNRASTQFSSDVPF